MKKAKKKVKKLLGRTDIVDFPNLKLLGIEVKIDTGAYTSSIHCHNIEVQEDVLRCQFVDHEGTTNRKRILLFKNFTQKSVKSSNGIVEERFAIKTKILIFETLYPIVLTLTERDSMKFPVLLGRKFLTKKFVIDTAKKNLSFKNTNINFKLL